ncbi:TlpA disulfide reductase family protein [Flammeovirgaceae bacterium SG7u.111]|nr:TlpA disulfide reductase family protein [Flammeovirgaceae bacterium SG7u.132]WPO37982.1 TlpA disulfide reductase family protein [Flammeovirgaceae bacterium SG7u.111]
MKLLKTMALAISLLVVSQVAFSQKVTKIGIKEVKEITNSSEDKLYVVNFWATWCAPCIAELPAFETAFNKYEPKGVEFSMISLDFPNHLEKKVIPFVERKSMPQPVFLLDYGKDQDWYNMVEEKWDGAIPVTLIFNNAKKQRKVFVGKVGLEKLDETIQSFLN